jgi:asparagine synthase (glutamine-hydrolysing)
MNPFDRMVHEEFFLRTLPSLLRNFDNAAMLSSVEIRMPFMDYRLVETAFSLPYSSKIGGGYTKRILRDSMKGIMPEAIRNRTFKVGLGAPTKDWFSGPLKDFIGDQLSSTGFKEHSLLSTKEMDGFKEKQHRGEWNEASAAQMWIALNAHLIQGQDA